MLKKLKAGLHILVCWVFILSKVYAQERRITGKVIDERGAGLSGAIIVSKGPAKAISSDASGDFSTSLASNDTLVVSMKGYITKEVQITGSMTTVSVSLEPDVDTQKEIVFTTLGIQRERKTLTYATQQISGDELRSAANINFVDALNGKIAGLDIKVNSSGVGGSTRALLRGSRSLQGSSEPLYVIDGIPMVNNKGDQPGSFGGTDGGDGLSMINPSDIDRINVLKGANASILYGSQGANGVVLITTKKGKEGKISVDLNSSTVFEQVSGLPKFQYRYGTTGNDYNWTPVGTAVVKSDDYQKDYIKDFFQTGITAANAVSIAGGNAKTNVYFSYANVSSTGVMPTSSYHKNNFSFRQSTKLLHDKITLSSGVILSSEVSRNRPGAGYDNNPLTGLYLFARERDFNSYKANYAVFNPIRNLYMMNWYSTEEKQNNPYWEINKNSKLQSSKRIIANAKISYDIIKNLKFEVRGNIDYNNVLDDKRYAAAGNAVSVSPNGTWNYAAYTDQSIYTDGIFTYNKSFGKLSLNALAGLSYQENIFYDGMTVNNGTVSLQYPNVFTFANMPYNVMFNNDARYSKMTKKGAFANLSVGFKDLLFLDLAGRNNWPSTRDFIGSQSNLNLSVGGAAIISKMAHLPDAISLLKARASLSQTTNEVPYNIESALITNGGAGGPNGPGGLNVVTRAAFSKLKPEKVVTNEYGIEAYFFKDKLGLDFTIYNSWSTNQFLLLPGPPGSGVAIMYFNAGKITNKGFELTLNAEAFRTDRFTWTTSLNTSQNQNKIIELVAPYPSYQIGSDNEGFTSLSKAGGSINDLYIYQFARNADGQIILSSAGFPTKEDTPAKVGNVNPKFLLGWKNNFHYRNFFASVLVNGKFGGVVLSKTEAFLDSYGVSERTAAVRDGEKIAIHAVGVDGAAVTSIEPYTYFSALGDRNRIMEPYVFSRTNVRLGQFVVGYTIKSRTAKLIFKDASISLVGRNLLFFYKKAPFDPEQAMSTSNSLQSADVFGMPSTRSYGLNLKFSF
ncbi:MAG: SusC/RagA family TonB-linked outer membrane protein [Dyadobacter sp.]|uniref:SusC/RagA family TonB-linked outer membrane protein n=1 Tax=Dyadobacter sp. TaxID=1914288 RepID=UPI001B295E47|nr:SusC/RagA family TonB-linked outer membrane protein [Dyadobacter sp.]MBO9616511.1 SusC/RagA family TonB-linked outer membrane protein [Dyadobacter sp.]